MPQTHGYSHAARISNATTGEAAWELIAGTRGVLVREIGITLAAATASLVGLARPAAKGITPTTPELFQAHRPGDADAVAATALAWATKPTNTSVVYIRRFGMPATIGSSIVWKFCDRGLWVAPSATLVLFNLAANGVFDVYAEIDH